MLRPGSRANGREPTQRATARTRDPASSRAGRVARVAVPVAMGIAAATVVAAPRAGAAASSGPERIYNGTQVRDDTRYPWVAALLRGSEPDPWRAQFCGGTLVDPAVVVTAAHCGDDASAADVEVAVGRRALSGITANERRTVAEIIVHPAYDPTTIENDIALLHLAAPVPPTTASPIRLAAAADIKDRRAGLALGWGRLEDTTYPDGMRQGRVKIIGGPTTPTCRDYPAAMFVSTTMVCAAGGGARFGVGPCYGDSGGPLVIRVRGAWVLAGITSWGIGCARYEHPGVYTRVPAFASFVTEPAAT